MENNQSLGTVVVPKQKLHGYNYMIVLIIACASFGVNMVNGMIGTTLGQPSFLNYFGFASLTATNTPLIGAINGVFFACAIFGCACAAYCGRVYGRKWSLFYGLLVAIIGNAMVAGSVHIAMLLVFRGVTGFTSGFTMSVANLLQSELALPAYRGLLVGHMAIAIGLGYTLSGWVGVGFYFVDAGGTQWRVPWALCEVPLLIPFCLLPWVPESPRWLCQQDRTEEARVVLRKLHGRGNAESDEFASIEVQQIAAQVQFEKEHTVSWHTIFTLKKYRRRALLTSVTMAMSQICGVTVIANYGPIIYGSLGFDKVAQLAMTAGFVTWGTLCAMVGALLVDKYGRVKLSIIGTALQVLCLSIVTALISIYAGGPNTAANATIAAFFYLFEASFTLFVLTASYTYITEIWPTEMRAQGTALGIGTLYFIDMIFLEASLYAFTTIGWKFYIVFISLGSAFLVAFCFLAKETKGLSLEEIGALFGDDIAVRGLSEMIKVEHKKNRPSQPEPRPTSDMGSQIVVSEKLEDP